MRSRITVSLDLVGELLASLKSNYVTVKEVSEMLAISTKSAGKLLRKLERHGYVERYSTRAYRIIRGRPEVS